MQKCTELQAAMFFKFLAIFSGMCKSNVSAFNSGDNEDAQNVRKWESASKIERRNKATEDLIQNIHAVKATKSMENVMLKKAMGAKKRILNRRRALAQAHKKKLDDALNAPATIKVQSVRILELSSKSKVTRTYAALCIVPIECAKNTGWACTRRAKGINAEYPFPKKNAGVFELHYDRQGHKLSKQPMIMIEIRAKRTVASDVVLGAAEVFLQMYLLQENRNVVKEVTFNIKNATRKIIGRAVAEIVVL